MPDDEATVTTTFDATVRRALALWPKSEVLQDNEGQLVIYTGLYPKLADDGVGFAVTTNGIVYQDRAIPDFSELFAGKDK